MVYGLPTVGVTTGPQWSQMLNDSISAIHDVPVTTVAEAGAAQTLTGPTTGDAAFDLTLNAASCNLTISGGTAGSMTALLLILHQDGAGSREVTWPTNVKWAGGSPAALTEVSGGTDLITLITTDGGATWMALVAAQNVRGLSTPTAPVSITTVGGNQQVTLSWAPPFDGGSPITGYKVYRSATPGGAQTLIGSPTNPTFTDTGRTNDVTYYYKVAAVNAIGIGPQSIEVSATPAGASTIVSDDFNRADATNPIGQADTGQTWSDAENFSYWGIDSNRAYVNTAGSSGKSVTHVEAGVSDCTVEATMAVLGANSGPALRMSDFEHLWYVYAQGGALYRLNGGDGEQIGSSFAVAQAGDVISLTGSGSTITVKINGVQVLQVTDPFNQNVTKHGFRTVNDTVTRFDNFRVKVP